MARPLRIEYPGACYHVMSRGNQRTTVFHNSAEHALLLRKLGRYTNQFQVSVFCYCCMPNHFHLYLKTQEANLGRFMQSLLTAFTVSVNRARGGSGHVFQGRFKAHLVEEGPYHAALSRYIHLNPVRVREYEDRALNEKRDYVRRFAWSSYGAYIGQREAPQWLQVEPVLVQWPGTRRDQMEAYRQYVEQELMGELESPCARATEQSIVGSAGFVDRIKRQYLLCRPGDPREEPALVHLQRSFALQEVTAVVCGVLRLDPDRVLRRRGAHRWARSLLMYCASMYCRHTSSLTELARAFGVSVSALTQARDRVAERIARDPALAAALADVERKLAPGVRPTL